jgi:hypothetical protein
MRAQRTWIVLVGVLTNMLGTEAAQTHDAPATLGAPRVFSLQAASLPQLRREIAAGNRTDAAFDQLRSDADQAVKQTPISVMDKTTKPPSGDLHDYLSLAPYWWPDPAKPNGLPYIRHDGQTNPEIERVPDHQNLNQLLSMTHTLALAYYLFGEDSYASRATHLLRVWFLNPETRMKPNLEFAQGIPGINSGRGTGLIETRNLYRLVDAIGLLAGSKSWTSSDQKGMEDWCARFLDWMLHSQKGKDEAAAKNNHGTYYDVQVVSLALFTGDTETAKRVLQSVPNRRIVVQIQPDGRQPLELERTKSLGYSAMNLSGLFELALLAESVGIDLWTFQSADGRSIHKALDYLVPFLSGQGKWPHQQIIEFKSAEISPVLAVAAAKFKDYRYEELAVKIDSQLLRRIEALPYRGQSTR